MKHTLYIILLYFILVPALSAEEGMFPLSEIHKLDLKARGFAIEPGELYNPIGVSLIDGIIDLDGCTASFVSSDGLILTNYHCAFDAIQSLTSTENDYLRDGFYAAERCAELPAKRYTVRLIESYRDVSRQVLSVLDQKMSHAQRRRAIEEKMKRLVVPVEKARPGKRAEVAEMFRGKTYVLFVYDYIKDVRLVYAPPRSVGEFGGEADNWTWPRHTGDFALMRAYVAPDGSHADYSPQNVPFHPRKHLRVAAEGVKSRRFRLRPRLSRQHAPPQVVPLPGLRGRRAHAVLHRPLPLDHRPEGEDERHGPRHGHQALLVAQGAVEHPEAQPGAAEGAEEPAPGGAARSRTRRPCSASSTPTRPGAGNTARCSASLARVYAEMTARALRDMILSNLLSSRISTLMGNAFPSARLPSNAPRRTPSAKRPTWTAISNTRKSA